MKRTAHPPLSHPGHEALSLYEQWMREREDLAQASIRNYLSDLRRFIAWYEIQCKANVHDDASFTPRGVATPTLTPRYRRYLQTVGRQKPASVNNSLISLKRDFGWATKHHIITYDPSVAVKLVGQEESAPRHLDDQVPSGKTKGALSERALGYIVKKYARMARLPDVSPHDLRHRFGYRMAESVPLHRFAQIMGHDSLDTTELYVQGTKQDLQEAVETITWT